MVPAEYKKLNIRRFEQLLVLECNPVRRALIQRLLADEPAKPDSAYSVDRPVTNYDTPIQ
jgi:hypothetical protein